MDGISSTHGSSGFPKNCFNSTHDPNHFGKRRFKSTHDLSENICF